MHENCWFIALLVISLMMSCSTPTSNVTPTGDSVATIVAGTLQAMTQLVLTPLVSPIIPTPTQVTSTLATLTPNLGKVTGKVCYPEGSSSVNAFFQEKASNKVVELPLSNNQVEYSVDIPPGTYIAYAWLPDFSMNVTYSFAVPCGLTSSCKSHGLLEFTILAGQTMEGIDLCDRFSGPFNVPYPPGYSPEVTVGRIAGKVYGYPGIADAKLIIVAFNQTTKFWYWFSSAVGSWTFLIDNLPPGRYQVVAYDDDGRSGGTTANVLVKAGQTTFVDIHDWSGVFPPNPVK